MSGGTFNMGGFATTLNGLFFTGGTLTQTVPLTLGVASPAAALTIQQGATLGTLGRQIVLSNSGGVLFSGTTGVATINNDINLGSGTVTFDTEASGFFYSCAQWRSLVRKRHYCPRIGRFTFAGTAPNTYAESTTINGSTLLLGKTGGAVAIPGNVVINAGTLKPRGGWSSLELSAMWRLPAVYSTCKPSLIAAEPHFQFWNHAPRRGC